jgi:heavy metal sensor kinase
MTSIPFRLRIAILSAAISGGVLLTFGATGWYLLRRERVAALDREIRALAYRHPGWMGGRANFDRLASTIEFVFGEDRKEQLILLVTEASGEVRYRSAHWPEQVSVAPTDLALADVAADDPTPPRAASPRNPGRGPPWAGGMSGGLGRGGNRPLLVFSKVPRFWTVRTGTTTWRLGALGNGDDRLVIGLDCADLLRELASMRNAFLIALPFALFTIGGGGWWVASRALRPLRSITRVAEGMTARGLDQRIAASDEDPEIARLVRVLNGMMDRLEASFRQAIRFSADASHELKTPLAVMQGAIEAALQATTPGSREQQALVELLEQTQRLKTITRSLLLLAQSDAGPLPLTRTRVDLSAELSVLIEDLEVLATDLRLRIERRLPEKLAVEVDWPLLRQAVTNVLQNAVRYNEADGWVRITLEAREGQAVVEVGNGGPGIPEADQPRLFDRFFRGDAARGCALDGAGLGLSLAREIVRAHGGTLELSESRPGQTCFRLALPVAPR